MIDVVRRIPVLIQYKPIGEKHWRHKECLVPNGQDWQGVTVGRFMLECVRKYANASNDAVPLIVAECEAKPAYQEGLEDALDRHGFNPGLWPEGYG